VTPCPVTIFTFGMLLLTLPPPSIGLLVIGGSAAAVLLEVPQEWLLLVSGIVSVGFVVRARKEIAA
jgi:Family of unknown function (DUF6064)